MTFSRGRLFAGTFSRLDFYASGLLGARGEIFFFETDFQKKILFVFEKIFLFETTVFFSKKCSFLMFLKFF